MNIIKKLEDSIWAKVILAVVVVVIAFAARSMLENKHEESKIDKQTAGKTIRETSYAETVPEDDPILNVFKNAYPTAEVLLACREDVTDDGLDDLVVICKMEEGNRTIVVTDKGDSTNYDFSDPIPAPVENQKIQFKNIDKEGEIEIIITGEKKGAVGYAIYRMIDGNRWIFLEREWRTVAKCRTCSLFPRQYRYELDEKDLLPAYPLAF